jgi:hypothetical protein
LTTKNVSGSYTFLIQYPVFPRTLSKQALYRDLQYAHLSQDPLSDLTNLIFPGRYRTLHLCHALLSELSLEFPVLAEYLSKKYLHLPCKYFRFFLLGNIWALLSVTLPRLLQPSLDLSQPVSVLSLSFLTLPGHLIAFPILFFLSRAIFGALPTNLLTFPTITAHLRSSELNT